MLETIMEAGTDSVQIQKGLHEEMKRLICDPLVVIGNAAIRAKIPRVQVDFTVPLPAGAGRWQKLQGGKRTFFCINPKAGSCNEHGFFSYIHGGPGSWSGVVLESVWSDTTTFLGPGDLVNMTEDRSELFHPELLATLVDAVNQLGMRVLEEIQLKNERDENLRCRVGGTRKVNQDLLDALDRDRVLNT